MATALEFADSTHNTDLLPGSAPAGWVLPQPHGQKFRHVQRTRLRAEGLGLPQRLLRPTTQATVYASPSEAALNPTSLRFRDGSRSYEIAIKGMRDGSKISVNVEVFELDLGNRRLLDRHVVGAGSSAEQDAQGLPPSLEAPLGSGRLTVTTMPGGLKHVGQTTVAYSDTTGQRTITFDSGRPGDKAPSWAEEDHGLMEKVKFF